MVKEDKAIVIAVVSQLRSNVAHRNTRQWPMIPETSDLETKWVWAMILAMNDKPSHQDTMSGALA